MISETYRALPTNNRPNKVLTAPSLWLSLIVLTALLVLPGNGQADLDSGDLYSPRTLVIVDTKGGWICNTATGELGKTIKGSQSATADSFQPINTKKRKKKLRARIRKHKKLLRSLPQGTRSRRLRRKLKKLKRKRKDLLRAIRDCKLSLPSDPPPPGTDPTPDPTKPPGTDPTPTPTPDPEQPDPTPTPPPPGTTPTPSPTPTATPPGWIRNPYYSQTDWKLWNKDQTPVTYNSQTYELPAVPEDRLYPDLQASVPWPGQFLAVDSIVNELAGFWDDGYKSEDDAHTMLNTSWSSGAASINLTNQFLRLNIGDFGGNPTANKTLGINFTSQSTTCMGHNLVEGGNISYNEQYYYFADTLRGGPAYYSFRDHLAERTIDSYEAIPVSGFHSFGRSGSEKNGLFKMLVSGGYMPRTTKDELKRTGLYPSALLYIYKASLPYANADGTPVSYTNELRHRVGYLSKGSSSNTEFMPYNKWYHRYDEGLHFYTMTQLAASMSVAPPVALLRFVGGERIAADGTKTAIEHNWEAGRTIVKSPLDDGEEATLIVDVGDSFDTQGLPLTYQWTILYPEQKDIVEINYLEGNRFSIHAIHNATHPKERIPVLFSVSNGVYDSNPAVVSFYPAQNSASCSSYQLGATPENEVNVNYRPDFSSDAGGDITIKAGGTAIFNLTCTDPEGFQTTLYRYLDEPGVLTGNSFSLQTNPDDAGKTIALHFICSDGTGAYNSLEQNVIVQ
jgi:hypothetical protein